MTEATHPAAIGPFVVLRKLGEGAMGIVYAGFDVGLDRKVALKLIRRHLLDNAEVRLRMLREAQAMARLSHPNVVHVYQVGEHNDEVYVAMEYVEGQTLTSWLHAGSRTWKEILQTMVAAGRGLAAAHAAGLVHRDFKPKSRRPSPTAPQPTDRPHSDDLGRFERVDVCRGVPQNAGAP